MNITLKKLSLAIAGAGLLTIYGCGGGGGGTAATGTTSVPITVIDGPIKLATVCLDKNSNSVCDTGEPFAKTDDTGKANLVIDAADAGKYPVIAVVGTDAIDMDRPTTPISVPFTMTAPADAVGVVSPLTTMVHQTILSTGASTAEAAAVVQAATGITVSLFQDFTTPAAKAAAAASNSPNPGDVARMVVVTTQQQSTAIASTVGTTAADNTTITQADLNRAIQKKLLELLPALVTAMSDPALLALPAGQARETALATAAQALLTNSGGLTSASMATVVAVNTQAASTAPVATVAPSAGFNLVSLKFLDASNFFVRVLGGSLAQNTPDSSNNTKFVERRYRANAGAVAQWGAGGDPWRQADLHWTGSTWASCPINFENTSGVRDAMGNNAYNYCSNLETGRSNRATFDIAGKTMTSVFSDILAAGYANLAIGDNTPNTLTTSLGTTTFPADSKLLYQTSTPLTNAIAYYPGSSNLVTQYRAEVSAGGVASTQPAGQQCNHSEFNTAGSFGANSTTLEGMIGAMTGTPCFYGPTASFTYGGQTYISPETSNEAWGNSTVGIGTLGTVPVGTGTAPGYYTGNTKLRVAFKGTGTNPVTYYACKERFNTGSTRNCTAIGTGTYAIATLDDARVLTLNNAPVQTAPLNYTKVFVERGGLIYSGYQSKPVVSRTARLNTPAANALFAQLGLPAGDPSVPLTLTAASYQGTYNGSFSGTDSGTFTTAISQTGVKTCSGTSTQGGAFACTFTLTPSSTDTTTAAITLGVTGNSAVFSGTANFYTGAVSGTWVSGSANGTFTGGRL